MAATDSAAAAAAAAGRREQGGVGEGWEGEREREDTQLAVHSSKSASE